MSVHTPEGKHPDKKVLYMVASTINILFKSVFYTLGMCPFKRTSCINELKFDHALNKMSTFISSFYKPFHEFLKSKIYIMPEEHTLNALEKIFTIQNIQFVY